MPDAPLLPELMRSLRSLGAHRDPCSEAAHGAIFIPLLEARARATASKRAVFAALKGASLAGRIEPQVIAAAIQGVEQPARIRALTAHAREIFEPLQAALAALDAAAPGAAESDQQWAEWLTALRRVFTVADLSCQELARLIAERSAEPTSRSWFSR
ncbi:MAG: hypothetical protein V4550_11330 [Gemmatimonadota bacterium]